MFSCLKTVYGSQDNVFVWHLYPSDSTVSVFLSLSPCPGKQLAGPIPLASESRNATRWRSTHYQSQITKSKQFYYYEMYII